MLRNSPPAESSLTRVSSRHRFVLPYTVRRGRLRSLPRRYGDTSHFVSPTRLLPGALGEGEQH